MQGQGSGAPTWSLPVHWMRWPWGSLGGEGQGQPPPVFCSGPLCLSYKAVVLVLVLEIPR